MGFARNLLRGVKDRLVGAWSDRVLAHLADTSSDAPSNFSAPKRDVYDRLKDEGRLDPSKSDR
ncbi:MAG: hypothetical protein RLZZ299_1467 [Pseudomonadota bacterium]|jgi:hypothetical protein